MFKKSKQHLRESNSNYLDHCLFAIYAAGLLFVASVASIIHAIIPNLFKGVAAYIVIKLYKTRLENHPNPLYRQWIENGIDNKTDNQ